MRVLCTYEWNYQKNTCKAALQASCRQLHYLKVKTLSQVHTCAELYLEIKFLFLEKYQWVHFIVFVFYRDFWSENAPLLPILRSFTNPLLLHPYN